MPMINQGLQFHSGLQSTLSKSGTDNTNNSDGASKRTRYGKLQSPRTMKGSNKNMKIGSHFSANTSIEARNNSPYRMRSKDWLKPKKVGNERQQNLVPFYFKGIQWQKTKGPMDF
ncbi:hypothetical protein FCV25MIE_03942 [Fagus crenata]